VAVVATRRNIEDHFEEESLEDDVLGSTSSVTSVLEPRRKHQGGIGHG